MRIGIIGCGKHVLHAHALACKDTSGFDLRSLYDISPEQMTIFEEAYGEKLGKYTDKEKFFDSIDAVLISTPDQYHYLDTLASIEHGKHTFVEKPIITTLEDLTTFKATLENANRGNLVISTCHPRRYEAQFIWLKDNLGSLVSELGTVLSL
jgi:predicted dehydrogenase